MVGEFVGSMEGMSRFVPPGSSSFVVWDSILA